jgi:hypothetical protein
MRRGPVGVGLPVSVGATPVEATLADASPLRTVNVRQGRPRRGVDDRHGDAVDDHAEGVGVGAPTG